jgi:membrane-associated protease RseP (regulator of RpoE activity)
VVSAQQQNNVNGRIAMKSQISCGLVLGVLIAQATMAGSPKVTRTGGTATIQMSSSSSGSAPVVHVSATTNINCKVMVKTIGPGGVQVFESKDGGPLVAAGSAGAAEPGANVSWLGVNTDTVSEELRSQLSLDPGVGLTVHGVTPESPAAKAGLQVHDVLTRLDDQLLMSPDQLRNLVVARKPGTAVKLTYLRKGKQAQTTATLGEHAQSTDEPACNAVDLGGLNLDLNKIISQLPAGMTTSCIGGTGAGGGINTSGLDLSKIISQIQAAASGACGSAGGTNTSSSVIVCPPIVLGSSGTLKVDSNTVKSVIELLKNLQLDDTNAAQAVQEALKALK